ncbi:hypothetical protein [Pseudoxanthomonas sp. Root630]|uniref:helix-turn-helix transcriptional regulator n=1 Tax=Pseudoxanthomonas sp. Root630 TaxID=1736574 RepID=UPI0009D73801|nr:hypothetical protein [Pseudoxanthomonas sp. Root630]
MTALAASEFVRVAQIVGRPAKGDRPAEPGILPISASTWWLGVKAKRYPAGVKLSRGVTVWRRDEVQAIASKAGAK